MFSLQEARCSYLSFPFRHTVRASLKRREGPKPEGSFIIANLTDLKKSEPASLLSAAGLPSPLSAPSVEQQVGMIHTYIHVYAHKSAAAV
jgi:hypothetical protein